MSFAISIQTLALIRRNSAVAMLTACLSALPLLLPVAAQQPTVKARPSAITGTDGTMTGTASFQGNFTTISAPPGQAVGLAREADCSLDFYTGSYTFNTALTYTRTGITKNYDRTLHTNAGLASTAGSTYGAGCSSYPAGAGSRPGLFLGRTPTNINVFAGLAYSPTTMGESLNILSGVEGSVTGYAIQSYSFSTASTLATADLNGDKIGDIVVSRGIGTTTGSVSVILGKTDGTITSPGVTYSTGGSATVASVIDDFDGDGVLDIVSISTAINSGDPQVLSFLKGNGDGTFANAVNMNMPAVPGATSSVAATNLASADLRGTGKKDIVCNNGLVLFNNTSASSATPFIAAATAAFPYMAATGSYGPNLALGDINKDGHIDIVLGTGNTVYTYLGKGDGTFTAGLGYDSIPSAGFVSINDLDGDGNPDIYVGLGNNGIYEGDGYVTNMSYALMGNGDGSFQGAYSGSGSYNGTNLGDVNGDGIPDLVAASAQLNGQSLAKFAVELGNGKGAFKTASTVPQPDAFSLTNAGFTYTFAAGSLLSAQLSTYAVGDIDGDGKADLVYIVNNAPATNSSGTSITYPYPVYLTAHANGDGTFAKPTPYAFPQIAPAADYDNQLTVTNLELVDLTQDGKLDMVESYNDIAGTAFGQPMVTPYQQGLAVLSGSGTGTFSTTATLTNTYSSSSAPTSALVPYAVASTDLNGDGKNDLIVYNSAFAIVNGVGATTSTYSAYLGNGDGTFATPTVMATATKLTALAIADLNNDGHPDIAYIAETSNSQSSLNTVLNNGSGGAGAMQSYNVAGGDAALIAGLAAADFDGDGKVDVALLGNNNVSGVFYGKGDGTLTTIAINTTAYPHDLINLAGGGSTIAVDLNKDGKADVLSGGTVLLNIYGSAPSTLATTTTALTANPASVAANGSVVLTATIASATAGTPTGTVTFKDGATSLGFVTLASGTASYTAKSLSVGAHSITAIYSGDNTFSTSTSSTVMVSVTAAVSTVATTTTLSASAPSFFSGTNVSFSATVAATSGSAIPTGTVTFTDGSTTLGTGTLDATGKATFATTTLAVGSHSVVATYGGATTASAIFTGSASAAVTVTVTAPGFTMALAQSSSSVTKGSAATNTLTITPLGGITASIALTCTGAPSGATCTINPASVTPNGSIASTATVTLQTSTSASVRSGSSSLLLAMLGLPALFGAGLSFTRFRSYGVRLLSLVLFGAMVAMSGCGGHSAPISGSTGSTATLTISASSSGTSQPPSPVTWTVTVN